MSSPEVEGKICVASSRGGGGFIPTPSSTPQAGDFILTIAKEGFDLVDEMLAEEHHMDEGRRHGRRRGRTSLAHASSRSAATT